jgi:hypothetical protein
MGWIQARNASDGDERPGYLKRLKVKSIRQCSRIGHRQSSEREGDKPVHANHKCGGCLWYGALDHTDKLGECKNAESPVYWNQGDDRKAVQIAPDTGSCMFYKSASVFLREGNRTARWWDVRVIALLRKHLYELVYPLVLTGLFFYYVFRSGPERYDAGYTRRESEELSL